MFCSFGQVFSHGLGVRHVGIFVGTRLALSFGENPLVFWAWGLGDGLCGFVLGLHTHIEGLI
jgi:hypothetical protein